MDVKNIRVLKQKTRFALAKAGKLSMILGGPAKVRPLAGMSMKKLCDFK